MNLFKYKIWGFFLLTMYWKLLNNQLKTNEKEFQDFPKKADQKSVQSWLMLLL